MERQYYRLAYWRVADEELNYRRFFDVGTLAAVRVEDPDVFDATHALLLSLLASGTIDGLRIDHPDGLADPRGYLRRLREATGGAWVVVEKILEGDEELPARLAVRRHHRVRRAAGAFGGLFVDPAGAQPLLGAATPAHRRPADPRARSSSEAKREIVRTALYAEVHRLTELLPTICRDDLAAARPHAARAASAAWSSCWSTFDRYRAYVVPGRAASHPEARRVVDARPSRARAHLAADASATLDVSRPAARPGGRRRGRTTRHAATSSSCASSRPAARDGQGRRGHRVLPLVPPGRAERGRRGPGAVRA